MYAIIATGGKQYNVSVNVSMEFMQLIVIADTAAHTISFSSEYSACPKQSKPTNC